MLDSWSTLPSGFGLPHVWSSYVISKHFSICPRSGYLLFPRMGSPNQNEAIKTWGSFFYKKVGAATIAPSTDSSAAHRAAGWLVSNTSSKLTERAIPAMSMQLTSSLLINETNREAVLQDGPAVDPHPAPRQAAGWVPVSSLTALCLLRQENHLIRCFKVSFMWGTGREQVAVWQFFSRISFTFLSVNRIIQMQREQHFLLWCNGKNTFQPAENCRGPISVQISVYEWIEGCPSVFQGYRNHADKTLWALVMS